LRAVAKARELKEQKTIGEDAARAISKFLTAERKHGMLFHGVTAAHPLYAKCFTRSSLIRGNPQLRPGV
jgi:hypothetical protein